MEGESSGLDFDGQVFAVGLDVDLKKWSVTIRNQGLSLKTFSAPPCPHKLVSYLRREYPGGTFVFVYEAGFCGFWIQRIFGEYGYECLVVNPADVPTANKEKDGKTDPIDSRKLARELEKGDLKSIYIPDESAQHFRTLVRLRSRVVKSTTATKNRIKGLLHFNGVVLPKHSSRWSGHFIQHLESVPLDQGPARDTLHFLLAELLEHRERHAEVLRTMRSYLKGDRVFQNLLTVPGVGPKTAMILYSEIIDIRRFSSFDQLKSFVGLIPSVHSSGERHQEKGLTRRRNRYLKYAMIESAWIAIRRDAALLQSYHRLLARMKPQDAIVRIARKLLSRIRHVWLNDFPYVTGVVQ